MRTCNAYSLDDCLHSLSRILRSLISLLKWCGNTDYRCRTDGRVQCRAHPIPCVGIDPSGKTSGTTSNNDSTIGLSQNRSDPKRLISSRQIPAGSACRDFFCPVKILVPIHLFVPSSKLNVYSLKIFRYSLMVVVHSLILFQFARLTSDH